MQSGLIVQKLTLKHSWIGRHSFEYVLIGNAHLIASLAHSSIWPDTGEMNSPSNEIYGVALKMQMPLAMYNWIIKFQVSLKNK